MMAVGTDCALYFTGSGVDMRWGFLVDASYVALAVHIPRQFVCSYVILKLANVLL